MNNAFGLGLVLSVEDEASEKLRGVWGAFSETETRAERMTNGVQNSFERFENLTISGLGLKQTGDSFLRGSKTILGTMRQIGSEVISVGDDFEQSRKTLEALYKSPDIAKSKMNWAMNLAAKTPFDVNDVKGALIGLKSAGVDADKTFKSVNGTTRTFLEYVGDLAGLRPDIGMDGVMMGVRNAIGGDGGKSLRARMDIDPAQILGHKLGGTTEQIMKDIVELSQKSANNLMQKLDGTWTQLVSNLEDQKTRFLLAISDEGAFDSVKKTLIYISNAVDGFDDTKLKNLGKALGDAFGVVWKPIDFVAKKLMDVIVKLEELVETHPKIAKVVLVILSATGALLGVVGVFFKFAGGMLMAVGSMGTFILTARQMGMTGGIFKSLGVCIKDLITHMAPLALSIGLVYLAWRTNFLGIRDIMQSFVNNCHTAFSYSKEVANMSFSDMCVAVDELREKFHEGDIFAGLTIAILKVRVFWMALVDAWNDSTLSDENFKKAKELGVLPLIEAILHLKEDFIAFVTGFKRGWKEINSIIVNTVKDIGRTISKVTVRILEALGIKDKVQAKIQEIRDTIAGIKPDSFEKLGRILGIIAPLLITVSGGFKIFKVASKLIGLAITPFIKLHGIIGKVSGALGLVITKLATNPFLLWTVMITGLIIGFVKLYKKCETFRSIVDGLGTFLCGVAKLILNVVLNVVEGIVVSILSVVTIVFTVGTAIGIIVINVIRSILATIMSVGAVIYGVIYTLVTSIITIFYTAGQVMYGVVTTLGVGIVSIFSVAFGIVGTVLYTFLGIARTIFEIFYAIVQTVVATVVAIFTGDFSTLSETLRSIWGNLGERLKEIWLNVCDRVKNLWSSVGAFLSQAWNIIKDLWKGIMDKISSFASNSVANVKKVWGGITGFFDGVWGGITSSARKMFSWLGDKFSWLTKIIDKTKSGFNWISGKVSSIGGGNKKNNNKMVGLSTGGYVKTSGIAVLHPNEVVVNDETTQMLRDFLITNRSGDSVTPVSQNSSNSSTQIDNSVTFEKGSIVLQTQGGAEELSDDLIDVIERKLERRRQIKDIMQYKPI